MMAFEFKRKNYLVCKRKTVDYNRVFNYLL